MKTVLLFLAAIVSPFLPYGQEETLHEIRFESYARGYQKKIILRADSVFFHENNPKTGNIKASRETTPAEWKQLTEAASDLSLHDIDKLESPGNARASDRALHSNITVITNQREYKSSTFDGYSPHKKLSNLVAQIREIENKTRPSDSH